LFAPTVRLGSDDEKLPLLAPLEAMQAVRRIALAAADDVAFGHLSGLGARNAVFFVAQYRPSELAVYA
jgi:hypothetical protein